MGFFGIFSGRSPESHEERGDEYMSNGAFGDALLEYEKALEKIEKRFPEKRHLADRIGDKIRGAGNGLAKKHLENAEAMIQAGEFSDARELYYLALELTEDEGLKREIDKKLSDFDRHDDLPAEAPAVYDYEMNGTDEDIDEYDDELEYEYEYDEDLFHVLCNALPEDMQEAYRGYGASFAAGYVALNQGDFETAAAYLEEAMAENRPPNLIPLELATAMIHMGEYEETAALLSDYVASNPEQPRAYQLLCEIFWETKEYGRAGRLLSQIPESIKYSRAMLILQGENLFQKKEYAAAESLFGHYINNYGKDEIVSRALAKTLEASGRTTDAKALYAEILNKCLSCGTRADPFLKRRYADICYQEGDTSAGLVDIYLGLVREDPDNRAIYFSRVSSILHRKGELDEARRYKALAEKPALEDQ